MSSSINGMAERFRKRLEGPSTIPLPGCYDILSAAMLEEAGFEEVFLSGYGVAASLLGNPDIGLTSLAETAMVARCLVGAIGVPLVVDVDNGYGNEDNVIRTIFEMEAAGAAAVQMEDQVFPKRCGHADNKKILPLSLYMKKLECALRARKTPLCIIARTDALDLDEAIMRANTFHDAGADATIIDGLKSLDAIKRFAAEVKGPKQINLIFGGKTPILPIAELQELGFKIALYSTPALYVVARSMSKWMKVLHDAKDLNSIAEESVTFADFQKLIELRYSNRHGTILND